MTILFIPKVVYAMNVYMSAHTDLFGMFSLNFFFFLSHMAHMAYIIFASVAMARTLNCDASDSLEIICRLLVWTVFKN